MTIGQALEGAQGGALFERLARVCGLSPGDCRAAMAGLAPAMAVRIQDTARDAAKFGQLLEMLEDNEGDLLTDGDLGSRDTEEDGLGVLVSAYGSENAARDEAARTAKALRLDEGAVLRLMPVAAALVLAILGKRHRELAGTASDEEARSGSNPVAPQKEESDSQRSGLLSVILAALGAGIARALANRFLPRRRKRYSYSRSSRARTRGSARPRRQRQPTLEEMFRGLLR